MDLDLIINIGISAILTSIKNPAKKASLKKAMLKVFNAIKTAYAGDEDFA
jgi:hypothetical protein